jgi:phenylpropionate dioxygenase-like ring-hydroxylating dioxygenase large terminal subunit
MMMQQVSSSRSRLLDLLSARRKLFSLPQELYTDPEVYALDLEAVFHKRWVFAGVECEIPNPGDYFTLTIGRSPILVLRDRTGAIRAFFNTCRHRGSKICLAERSTVRTLVCPYHQWSYDCCLLRTGCTRDLIARATLSNPSMSGRRAAQSTYVSRTMPTDDAGSVRWVHFPSTFNHALADYAVLVRMLPLGPQEMSFTTKWLVHRDAEEGRDYDLQTLVQVWSVTNDQDKVLVERNQEGVNSAGYTPGPYSQDAEQGVIRFVEWYCATLEAHLDKRPQHSIVAA